AGESGDRLGDLRPPRFFERNVPEKVRLKQDDSRGKVGIVADGVRMDLQLLIALRFVQRLDERREKWRRDDRRQADSETKRDDLAQKMWHGHSCPCPPRQECLGYTEKQIQANEKKDVRDRLRMSA